jgi:hypothetical protein
MAVMLARFHRLGIMPSDSERLKRRHIEGAISSATPIRILFGKLSGPLALFASKLWSTSETS